MLRGRQLSPGKWINGGSGGRTLNLTAAYYSKPQLVCLYCSNLSHSPRHRRAPIMRTANGMSFVIKYVKNVLNIIRIKWLFICYNPNRFTKAQHVHSEAAEQCMTWMIMTKIMQWAHCSESQQLNISHPKVHASNEMTTSNAIAAFPTYYWYHSRMKWTEKRIDLFIRDKMNICMLFMAFGFGNTTRPQ